jgi:tRNA U38,U39,U40 pseudouridine synthase TruA
VLDGEPLVAPGHPNPGGNVGEALGETVARGGVCAAARTDEGVADAVIGVHAHVSVSAAISSQLFSR